VSMRSATASSLAATGLRTSDGELCALMSSGSPAPAFTGGLPPTTRALASEPGAVEATSAPAPTKTSAAPTSPRSAEPRRRLRSEPLASPSGDSTPVMSSVASR